jgi:NAD(P)-dependent dehydrogenase (short-subunit alcohol dehydrogenase family)
LGKAIALRLAVDGARVVISDVQSVLGQATASEHGLAFVTHDVCDELHWSAVVAEVEATHGRLDVLVNNAGIMGRADAVTPENTLLADWNEVFGVNVTGVFLGCRAAIPAMRRAGGGSIVNVSSISAMRATPHATAYGASKAAVRHLTRSVAQYCAQERLNIRCNSVHPGFVPETPLWREAGATIAAARGVSPEDAMRELVADARARVPLGDLTRGEDVAAAVSFLVSDDARHITGEKMIVDGGVVNCDTYVPARIST